LIGCGYCQWQRGFWVESSVSVNAPKKAFIRLGTNVFSDTAGNHIQFKYCPMCGKPLPSPPDNGGVGSTSLPYFFRIGKLKEVTS